MPMIRTSALADFLSSPQAVWRTAAARVERSLAPAAADPSPAAKPKDNVPRGILCMIAATVLFAVTSALAKWLVAIYPVGEVMFFRSLSSLIVCALVILP